MDTETRNKLVMAEESRKLVRRTVSRFRGRIRKARLDTQDLIQFSTLKLLELSELYDPSKSESFAAYASRTLRLCVMEEIGRLSKTIAVSQWVYRKKSSGNPTAVKAKSLSVGEIDGIPDRLLWEQRLSPEEDAILRDHADAVNSAIAGLPEKNRAVLLAWMSHGRGKERTNAYRRLGLTDNGAWQLKEQAIRKIMPRISHLRGDFAVDS